MRAQYHACTILVLRQVSVLYLPEDMAGGGKTTSSYLRALLVPAYLQQPNLPVREQDVCGQDDC